MLTTSKEVTIKLHLYTSDPSSYFIPATHEFGEDIECNSLRGIILEKITHELFYDYRDFKFNTTESIKTPLLVRYIYEHKDYDVQFIVNILTDSDPWPQKNIEECKKRKELADNGALGQSWWIHHITLPNGDIIEDCDKVTKEIENKCVEAVEDEIDKFLQQENLL